MNETYTPIIETTHLLLRRLTMDDLPALYAIYSEPGVRRYFPDPVLTYAETQEELEYLIELYETHGFGLWATVEKASGRLIGRCGLLPWTFEGRQEVEVAYLLERAAWGRGLGVEAARASLVFARDILRLPRLICMMMPENRASAAIAQKLGMRLERERLIQGVLAHQYAIDFELDE
jgi:ribosomal-protein-alanine N-acetyltransferase